MKNIMIIGSNRGIGLAIAKEYSDQNYEVYALCREASSELRSIEKVKIFEQAEVTNLNKLNHIATKLNDVKFDIMIHVSGIWRDDHLFEDTNWDAFSESFEVNSVAPLKTVTIFKNHLKDQAKIGLMSSRMGSISDNTSGGRYAYRMSKCALNCAGKSLSEDFKDSGIAIAVLHPGFVKTDMTDGKGDITPKESAQGIRKVMDDLSMKNSGSFFHSNGEELTW